MIKTVSCKSQIGVYSFRNMKPCTSFGREGSSSIFSSINITSKVGQYMTIDAITNDIHIALDTSDMLQSAHVIMVRWWLQKNRWIGTSSSATTTMNRLFTWIILCNTHIAWQPLNKLCWEKIGEKIRGSTPIDFCIIAGPFSLSDNALWQIQLLLPWATSRYWVVKP